MQFFKKLFSHIIHATSYSFFGLKSAFTDEFAFRLEVAASIIILPAAYYLGHSAIERALLVASFLLVLIIELLNSAIETTLNRIDTSWHALTKKGKDMASAAVFLAMLNGLFVWGLILFSHF